MLDAAYVFIYVKLNIFFQGTLLVIYNCFGIHLIDVSDIDEEPEKANQTYVPVNSKLERTVTTSELRVYPPIRSTTKDDKRRYLKASARLVFRQHGKPDEEKDTNLKNKISMLVQQAIHDAKIKMKTVEDIKEKYKDDPSYRVGFIFSNLKKSKDVMNELFNVAIKHRHDWKALEQMKIFELIVHTNVDTTNLVRQLVEIHLQHMNSTDPVAFKRRVVLL